jgi:hypothetical protein
MALTPAERQSLVETLHRHIADVEGAMAAGIYETNKPSSGRVVATRLFALPGLGDDEAKRRGDQTLTMLRGILGEERWPLVQVRLDGQRGRNVYSGGNVLAGILHLVSNKSGEELWVRVQTDDKGTLTVDSNWAGHGVVGGFGSGALSRFLPEGDPNRTEGSDEFGWGHKSEALRQRALTWLQKQAIARLGKEARP